MEGSTSKSIQIGHSNSFSMAVKWCVSWSVCLFVFKASLDGGFCLVGLGVECVAIFGRMGN